MLHYVKLVLAIFIVKGYRGLHGQQITQCTLFYKNVFIVFLWIILFIFFFLYLTDFRLN